MVFSLLFPVLPLICFGDFSFFTTAAVEHWDLVAANCLFLPLTVLSGFKNLAGGHGVGTHGASLDHVAIYTYSEGRICC